MRKRKTVTNFQEETSIHKGTERKDAIFEGMRVEDGKESLTLQLPHQSSVK